MRVQHLQGSDRSLTDQMKVSGQSQRNQEELALLWQWLTCISSSSSDSPAAGRRSPEAEIVLCSVLAAHSRDR